MDNYLEKLKNDIQILIDSLDQVSNSKITFKEKNKLKPIKIDEKNLNSTYLSLGSLWYEFYYSHFIDESKSPNQVSRFFRFSEPLYRISQKYNPISINKNWHVEEILDKGNSLLLKKGFRSLFMDRGAVYAEKPYEVVEKYSEINLLDSSGFQYESDDTWIRIYGKIFPRSIDDAVRHYFNINQNTDSDRILEFMDSVIREFNENKVVFNLKIITNRNKFLRADSLVIYVEKRSLLNSFYILGRIHNEFSDIFRDKTPLFTRALGRGWGIAEEPNIPNDTSSFGQNRIRQMSIFFINYIRQHGSIPIVDDVLKEIISLHNLPEKYYLNIDSKIFIPEIYGMKSLRFNEGNPRIDYLKNAVKIANLLGSQTIWSHSLNDKQCLWISNYYDKKKNVIASTICGIKMLRGTTGIAFFYSCLYKETENEYFRLLAQGALNHSINIFSKRFDEYKDDLPYIRSIYFTFKKINLIASNLSIKLDGFNSEIHQKFESNLKSVLQKNELTFILFNLKSGAVKLSFSEMCFIKNNIFSSINNIKEYDIIFAISILLKIDSIWMNDEKEEVLEIIDDLIERYLKSQIYKNSEIDFFESFKEIYFIYQKLKNDFGRSFIGINEIIDFFKIKWLDEQSRDERFTYNNEGIFQYLEFLEALSKLFPKTFSPSYVDSLLKKYSNRLMDDFLQYDCFPTFDLGKGVYNPGLYDGVAGIGYFFLRQYDLELPILNEVG
jgi:HopA1 effector protein family